MNRRKSSGKKTGDSVAIGKEFKTIILPKPARDNGRAMSEAFKKRKTTREISNKKFSTQMLSNLLWAACGINRKKGPFGIPGRTAGSASNSQEIDIYAAMKDGVYLYEAKTHSLIPIVAEDLRIMAIGQGQGKAGMNAPVRLIYVADLDKFSKAGFQEPGLQNPETQKAYYYVDTGMIAANVYLFAASHGLAAWFHNCDKEGLAAKLNLRNDQRVLFGQTVGYASHKS
jgi:hypothetical protein